jgi:hypothetical protein
MQSNDLKLRTVESLREESFFVPSYQRGYRWTTKQVVELLEDVWEFAESGGRSRGEFYCLQPIVVAARRSGWEVVDGQQRLTTLRLLLSHFNERKAERYRDKLFSITYDTRPASAAFLSEIRKELAHDNIDFFHMAGAAAGIEEWFSTRSNIVADCEQTFRNNVKVIWYEIAGEVKPTDVFRRLNIGKIPLADAELVKALFLRCNNFADDGQHLAQLRQLQLAGEWDAIERRLQDDEFWFFLTNSNQQSNRIDFVLRIAATLHSVESGEGGSIDSSIFHVYYERLQSGDADVWTVWREVKKTFLLLEEWYDDPALHHLVGYLASLRRATAYDAILDVIHLAAASSSKRQFRQLLKEKILSYLFGSRWRGHDGDALRDLIEAELGELDYESDGLRIRSALLLFNLVTLLNSGSRVRFPFGVFKRERWDIEHVRSVASRMPGRVDDQKEWLRNVVAFFRDSQDTLVQHATALVEADRFDSEAFRKLFEELREQHDPGGDSDVDNSIGNLALLDAETNRSYGNAMFPIKRKRIIQRDMNGSFVPLCTKNVFLKYYSPQVDGMLMWSKSDSQAHARAIVDCLAEFFDEGSHL